MPRRRSSGFAPSGRRWKRRLVCLALVAAYGSTVTAAGADTVLLANGNRFEDVIATVEPGTGVRIRFSYGELTLPEEMVLSVRRSDSPLAAFLARSEELAASPAATAADWLALAERARADGLTDGYRRAVRRAADLDPALPEVAAHMHGLDFVLDGERGRWIPWSESRAAREEAEAARRAAAADAHSRAAVEEERRRLVDAIEMLALAELVETLEERRAEPPPAPFVAYPTIGFVGVHHVPFGVPPTEHNRRTMRELTRRQPGSLLPVVPRAHDHGRRPSGDP